jgi:hypothetical protein
VAVTLKVAELPKVVLVLFGPLLIVGTAEELRPVTVAVLEVMFPAVLVIAT